MRTFSYLLLLLLVCRNADAQSSGTSRFLFRFAVEVGENIIANLAADHIKNSVRWGSAGTPEGNYAEGLKQWRNGNKEDARRYMRWSAESGYSPAQLFLGDVESAEGNYGNARAWYEKAAGHQESWAEFQLGNFAYYGKIGGVASYGTALHWYRLSAGRHEVKAELMVADILLNNRMHPINSREAFEVVGLLTDAAGRGSALGRADLGYMYLIGLGADRNICRGLDFTRQAVMQENPVAIGNLGALYENGILNRPDCPLEQDRIHALELYRRAATLGENRALDASRLENTLKREITDLMAGSSGTGRVCALVSGGHPDVYDANLNRTGDSVAFGHVFGISDNFARIESLIGGATGGSRFVKRSQVTCFNNRLTGAF